MTATLRRLMARMGASVRAWWGADGLRDVVLLVALGLIGVGVGAWSPPAACVVVGVLLLVLAWPPAPADPTRRMP